MIRGPKKIKIFSALEVANLCGVVNQTAINWIRNGHLKAFTTPGGQYRVYAEDLAVFLEARGMRFPHELDGQFKGDVDWNRLLIVDDDEELNNVLKSIIATEMPDIEVDQAFDGFEAGRLIAENRPAFVLLDIFLPGLDGIQLCKRIKEDPVFGKPFVIAISGVNDSDSRDSVLGNGADAFFGKPLDFDGLVGLIRQFLEKVEVEDAE